MMEKSKRKFNISCFLNLQLKWNFGLKKLSGLDLIIFILTIYVLISLLIDTIFDIDEEYHILLQYIDFGICGVFFLEFWYKLYKADDKKAYLKWGWIDLLSSIPMYDSLRFGRILKLIRIVRIFRTFKSLNDFYNQVYTNKAESALSSVVVLAILLVITSAFAILQFENHPDSNILNAEDALWWAYVTITTVGYGDKYPVTTEGRALAVILMTFGVGIFGTFAAYISSLFLSNSKKELKNDKIQ